MKNFTPLWRKLCFLQYFIWGLLVFIQNSSAQKISITAFPDDYVYIFEESRKDGISNLIIHNIGILNTGKSVCNFEALSISFYNKGNIIQQNNFKPNQIIESGTMLYQLQQAGQLENYDFLFRTKDILQGTKLTNNSKMDSQTGLILSKLFFTSIEIPDSIIIKATGNIQGKKVVASKKLLTRNHQSANKYIFPLAGNWFVHAGPSAHTHHRWAYMEEFAYDIAKTGDDNLTYKNDYKVLNNYYCFGKDVLAVEAGEVEEILDGIEDSEIYPKDLAQPEYMKMVRERQNALIQKYGMQGIGGNYIIIKHPNNEYSFYGHLKNASIKVKKGDKIEKGQTIAAIGNSGNSTEPHLHFQLNESKNVLSTRSIPIRFSNINYSESFEPEGSYLKSGEMIKTK